MVRSLKQTSFKIMRHILNIRPSRGVVIIPSYNPVTYTGMYEVYDIVSKKLIQSRKFENYFERTELLGVCGYADYLKGCMNDWIKIEKAYCANSVSHGWARDRCAQYHNVLSYHEMEESLSFLSQSNLGFYVHFWEPVWEEFLQPKH